MSGIALAILFVGGAGAYGVLGVILGRRFIHRHVADGHNDVLVPLFAATGVIYAVLPWLLGRRRLAGL
jgi:H+/Cl- antiporter ClcA